MEKATVEPIHSAGSCENQQRGIGTDSEPNVPDLPDCDPEDEEVIGNVTFGFGDVLTERHGAKVAVPSFQDGFLFKSLVRDLPWKVDGRVDPENPQLVRLADDQQFAPGAGFILFRYENCEWSRLLERIIKVGCDPGDTLIVPTFGTNNEVPFLTVATNILSAVKTLLDDTSSEIHGLKSVRVITPFDQPSKEVIQHVFHLIRNEKS